MGAYWGHFFGAFSWRVNFERVHFGWLYFGWVHLGGYIFGGFLEDVFLSGPILESKSQRGSEVCLQKISVSPRLGKKPLRI